MLVQQRTINHPVSMSGVGLHTGNICTLTFKPAPENYGIRWRRVDLPGEPEVPADVDHVVDIARGTTIELGAARVHTVEHVMAALTGLQIDNVLIELDNNEPPVGDGSAKPYVDCLLKAGFYLMILGALGAVAAFLTGMFLTSHPSEGEIMSIFEKHETGAWITLVTICIGVLLRIYLAVTKKEQTSLKWIVFALYCAAFGAVAVTGHLGGYMVYNYMIGL